jgi:arsenite methyltransferase
VTAAGSSPPREEPTRQHVRERYALIASIAPAPPPGQGTEGCCGTSSANCCGGETSSGSGCGYSEAELADLPAGANLGLGCGNPTALLSLQPGEVVLDLGSGAGIDCFLAARQVGPTGRAIGVDMTPEMLVRARANARQGGYSNVEFRLGEIEHLPVADRSVDVVISNCVINLAPDKGQVYREAFRVLRPGGRLAVSDVLATRPISEEMRNDPERWASCSSGALTLDEVTERLRSAGFESIDVSVVGGDLLVESLRAQDEIGVMPGEVRATKPRGTPR